MAPGASLWNKVPFGRTGLTVSRLAIGSSYGIDGLTSRLRGERPGGAAAGK